MSCVQDPSPVRSHLHMAPNKCEERTHGHGADEPTLPRLSVLALAIEMRPLLPLALPSCEFCRVYTILENFPLSQVNYSYTQYRVSL